VRRAASGSRFPPRSALRTGRRGVCLKFGRNARLRTRVQFDQVQRSGRRVSTRFWTLIGFPNSLEIDRLGIIASRRLGGAVIRNRAKRRVREVFRRRDPRAGQALDVVVIARHSLIEAAFPEVEADFRAALGRLRGVKYSS